MCLTVRSSKAVNTDCIKQAWAVWTPALSPPRNHRRGFVRARTYFVIKVKADPFLVSLGCHCTELRDYVCELNKLIPHCTTNCPVTQLCNLLLFLPSSGYPGLAESIVKGISLSCMVILATCALPGSLGFVLNI